MDDCTRIINSTPDARIESGRYGTKIGIARGDSGEVLFVIVDGEMLSPYAFVRLMEDKDREAGDRP